MEKRLKKDIVIPAGTILKKAPTKTLRYGNDHFDCVVGISDDSSGFFTYCIDDHMLGEWFEDIE